VACGRKLLNGLAASITFLYVAHGMAVYNNNCHFGAVRVMVALVTPTTSSRLAALLCLVMDDMCA
jgi:hypothetical protein